MARKRKRYGVPPDYKITRTAAFYRATAAAAAREMRRLGVKAAALAQEGRCTEALMVYADVNRVHGRYSANRTAQGGEGGMAAGGPGRKAHRAIIKFCLR